MNDLVVKNVSFCGAKLLAVQEKENGKIYAGITAILRELGFDEKQIEYRRDKWKNDRVLKKGTRKFSGTLLGVGTGKEIWCIEVKKLPLALAKLEITPRMEKDMPELSGKLEKYQDECADVLAEAFLPKKAGRSLSATEQLQLQRDAILEVNEKVGDVEQRVEKLENNMTITHEQIQIIKNRVNKKVTALLGGYENNAYKDKHLRGKAYSHFNKDYCDYFRINARANTLTAKFDEALGYIDMWEPDTNLRIQIKDCNAQMNMEVA